MADLLDGHRTGAELAVQPHVPQPGEAARDFLRLGPSEHGVRGLVHLMGIESPGLTSSLALAAMCADELVRDGKMLDRHTS